VKLPDFKEERDFWSRGILVAGVDEAGRGALAGPVFAAAVIYPLDFQPSFDVFDSKTISPKKRENLYEQIITNCLSYSVAMVGVEIIDSINILEATLLAMNTALEKLKSFQPFALIDGNRFKGNFPHKTIVDGDASSFSIASASIVAKVERDRWMANIAHKKYPQYGFDRHKGYGTKFHIEQILINSPSPLHRKTFLRNILNKQGELFKLRVE